MSAGGWLIPSHHSTPKTLNTVQALRAFAACGVLYYHVVYVMVHRAGYSVPETDASASGVDLFFAVSGFIMIYTTADSFGQPRASSMFLRRRLIRIVPLYWLCTAAVVLLLGLFSHWFRFAVFEWGTAIPSFFFLLSRNIDGNVGTVLQTGWTLCFEMYFYAIFAILLHWPRRYFLFSSAAIFGGGLAVGIFYGELPPWASVATDPLLLEFFAGTVIGFLFIRGFSVPAPVATFLIVVAIAAIAADSTVYPDASHWGRIFIWGLPCTAILAAALSLERFGVRVPRFVVALGNSSYSLYLTHPFVLPVFGKVGYVWHLSDRVSPLIFGLCAFLTSIAVGHLIHHLIEMPLTRYLSVAWKGPGKQPAHAV